MKSNARRFAALLLPLSIACSPAAVRAASGSAPDGWDLPSAGSLLAQLRSAEAASVPAVRASAVEEAGVARPALPNDVLPVPIHQQETDYSCGAASLFTVLRYWQVFDGKERDLYGPLQTDPKEGTEPPKLRDVAEKFGLKAELKTKLNVSDLRAALSKGQTVIVDIQAWREKATAHIPWEKDWEDGHYVVLIAMDDKYAFFMDPVLEDAYAYMP